MKNIEIAILNYENQLLASRRQLNDLIYECQQENINDALLNDKLNHLQNEMEYMNQQLFLLKNDLHKEKNVSEAVVQNNIPPLNQEMARMQSEMTQPQSGIPSMSNNMAQSQNGMSSFPNNISEQQSGMPPFQSNMAQPQGGIPPFQNNMAQPQGGIPPFQNNMAQSQNSMPNFATQNRTTEKRDMESVIGKSWMGIFASVLIFISLVLFATLLAPFITDTIKMVAMYVLSISFTGFGLIKLKKHNNKAYLAISSCGVGAIYISMLLSHLYFEAIGYIALYLLILIWAVFVCYLARLKDKVFQMIGQCGITISMILGCMLCGSTQDTMKLFMLSMFFAVTSLLFFISNMQKEFGKNTINYVFHCINVFLLWITMISMDNPGWYLGLSGVVVLVFLIAQFVFFFMADLKENNVSFAIFTVINAVLTLLVLEQLIASDSVCGIVYVGMGAVLLALTEWKCIQKNKDGKILLQIFCMILLEVSLYRIAFFEQHIGSMILMLPILLLGYYKKDFIYKYGSLCMVCIYIFSDLPIAEHLGFGVLYFGVLAYLLYTRKEQYNGAFKLVSYILAFFYLCLDLEEIMNNVNGDISLTVLCTVFGLLNVLAMKSVVAKNFKTFETEKESIVVTSIVNAMFMLLTLHAITDVEHTVCHIVLIMLAIVLFMANTKNLLAKKNESVAGFYIGIKLTILVIAILSSFDAVNYMISISLFLFAIISIVIGFRFIIKSFRLYGLILSMISIVKLIMIDISYENTLGHALSFFICGILCFVISLIYNVIDKKIREQ